MSCSRQRPGRPSRTRGSRPDAGTGGQARDHRHRPVRAAMPAGRTGRLVPGGDGRADPLALGVVRACRPRGPGVRHASGGGERGRAAHRRQGRLLGCPGGQPRPGGLGARDPAAGAGAEAAAGPLCRRAATRVDLRLVRDRGPAGHGVYRCHGRDSRSGQGIAGMAPRDALGEVLDRLGVEYTQPEPGAYLIRLPGEHKLATMTWLVAGQHSLRVEAFFCRQPVENHAAYIRFLHERNGRVIGEHFALDRTGDVYLAGRLPLAAITDDEIDRLLGCVLTYSDESFNEALKLGFGSAIRREWAWREKRGES